ncbi:MAG: cupin domain-containing protein [Alphaproteobacteria bacterium]|nr:cupin domain-containing protein [Alphaproteobacteria bacterium]
MSVSVETRRLIDTLRLEPHPEGGWYRETYRDAPDGGERGAVTQIFYLLAAGEVSAWHRVTDATEIWHHYAGAPLTLTLSPGGHDAEAHTLGGDVLTGQTPHVVVRPGWWQTAASLGAWTLCGCTVAPAFEFAGFEMAPPDWRPTPRPTAG